MIMTLQVCLSENRRLLYLIAFSFGTVTKSTHSEGCRACSRQIKHRNNLIFYHLFQIAFIRVGSFHPWSAMN